MLPFFRGNQRAQVSLNINNDEKFGRRERREAEIKKGVEKTK